ncbi:cytochrome P450 [Actinomadura oligospora]|uniref:cytochrome P450 n=1 Tax=Actinomadura oligospora TaxID=111804 RepID=UPI0004BA649A|nr:cytochrome P450 [Actinomadura oligospora]
MRRPPGPRDGVIAGVGAYEADRPGYLAAGTARFGDVWQVVPRIHFAAGLDATRQVLRRTGEEFEPPRGTFALPRRARREDEAVEAARIRTLRHHRVGRHAGTLAIGAAELAESWPRGTEAEALPRLAAASARMAACYHFGPDAAELMHGEEELAELRATLGPRYVHLPGWVPAPSRLRVRRAQHHLAARIRRVIDRRAGAAPYGTSGGDVLDELMRTCDDNGVNPRVYLPFRMVTAMVAAREMVGPAAGWVLAALAENPRWAERVAAEAEAVLPCPDDVDGAVLSRLTSANAFVRETLRLYPPNWLLSRVVARPVQVGGYDLQPGERVMVSPYLLHRDPRYFPDADVFDPERWLRPANGPGSGAYLPYGAGPRTCPGASLASVELVLIAAFMARRHLVRRHSLTPTTWGTYRPSGLTVLCRPRDLREAAGC